RLGRLDKGFFRSCPQFIDSFQTFQMASKTTLLYRLCFSGKTGTILQITLAGARRLAHDKRNS
ncbi:MAG: hypothetical protein JXA10_02225, partial [Anaerolineae bacterium]|nr:hypothetical protein [Anaerolineae bacterium]